MLAIWEATCNEVLYDAFNQIGNLEVLDSYVASGNFLRDYISYVNILGIFPHPKIVRDLRTLLDDIAREDDVNRTRMNSKKKGIKKAPVKRSGVLEDPPSRGRSRADQREADSKAIEGMEAAEDSTPFSHVLTSNIEVKGWRIDDGTARALSLALQSATSIQSLRLYNTEMSDQAWHLILDSVSRNTSLQSLALEAHTNLPPVLASLQPSATFSSIQQISLISNRIEDDVLIHLLQDTLSSSQLVSLDLWDNRITDTGASAIATFLHTNTSLTTLSLGKNCVGDAGAVALCSVLGRFSLSPDETATRKKLKSDLEFKKKEGERRKKKGGPGLVKSKSDKSASTKEERGGSKGDKRDGSIKEERSGSKSEKRDATIKEERSATPEAQKRRSGKKPEPSLDDQIAALQPVEEIDGVWYVEGNRSLVSLNLRLNRITDTGAEALLSLFLVNPVLKRCVLEHNPLSDEMKTTVSEQLQAVEDRLSLEGEVTLTSIDVGEKGERGERGERGEGEVYAVHSPFLYSSPEPHLVL